MGYAEKSIQSIRCPISIQFGGHHGAIAPFSIKHQVGFTRSLAAKMVLEFWGDLSRDQQVALAEVFKSCLMIKGAWESAANAESEFFSSVRGKFQLAESTRPDVIQLYHGWQALFAKMGVDFNAGISDHRRIIYTVWVHLV